MAIALLRPMSVGEILDASLALLRRHLGLFFSVAIVCQAVPQALGLYYRFAGDPTAHLGLFFVAQVLSAVGYFLVTAATIRIVSQAYLGHEPQFGEAMEYAFSKIWRSFAAGFASGILICLAALLLIIPGIVVACGLAVAVQAAVLEPLNSGTDGIGRSWALTKGFKGKAFVLWFVSIVLAFVVLLGIGLVTALATLISTALVGPALVLWALVSLLLYPFLSCVFTLFYYDLRVRKEAFDLELLSQQIGIQPVGA
jgi:hypothetical protein